MAGLEFKQKGNEFFKKAQYEEAIIWYSKAIEKEPSNHAYYSNRSAAKTGMKDYKGAIEDANLCIKCKLGWQIDFVFLLIILEDHQVEKIMN